MPQENPTRFFVEPPETASARAAGCDPPAAARRPRVLVVDDEASIRLGCVVTLRSDGWDAVGEASSRAALERLSSGHEHFDVLVLDYAMPDLDGLALAGGLDPRTRPPIVLASAHADGATALAALRMGIWDFQAKPMMPHELRGRVHRLHTRAKDAAAPHAWLARALLCCQRCAWSEALGELQAWPAAERADPADLVTGLVCQLAGHDAFAALAFQRARWWPDWHRQGVEMWAELARRLG